MWKDTGIKQPAQSLPWWPIDEGVGVSLGISLKQPTSTKLRSCTAPVETHWETWVSNWVGGEQSVLSLFLELPKGTPQHYTPLTSHWAWPQWGRAQPPATKLNFLFKITLFLWFRKRHHQWQQNTNPYFDMICNNFFALIYAQKHSQ